MDGYDSSLGTYAEQAAAGGLTATQLGSNDSIALRGTEVAPVVVHGNATPGVDHTVLQEGNVHVAGSTEPALELAELPPVVVPQVESEPGRRHSGPVPLVIAPGTSGLEFLQVASSSQVVVEGPCMLVVGTLQLAPGSELVFDTREGAVGLFVTGRLEWPAGSVVSTPGCDPTLVSVQVAGTPSTPVQLHATSQFHGAIYAPEADVALSSPFELYGSLAGERLDLSGPVRLHFDRRLLDLAQELTLPTLLSWRIVELGNVTGAVNVDPFLELGLDPSDLPRPADAHGDQVLEVGYLDENGDYQTYVGPESDFDWGPVGSVVSLLRDGVAVVVNVTEAVVGPLPIGDLFLFYGLSPSDSSELRDTLIGDSPLTPEVLAAAIKQGGLNDSHLRDVLESNAPLDSPTLNLLLDKSPAMSSSSLRDVLIESSPLPLSIVTRITLGSPLSVSDRLAVLTAQ
jgi:hypothetical protein